MENFVKKCQIHFCDVLHCNEFKVCLGGLGKLGEQNGTGVYVFG